jgi:hypothetical protein
MIPTPFPPCPRCGSTDAARILYGYPSSEMFEASERGEIILGGCLVGPESPAYECRACRAPLPWVARCDEDLAGPLAVIRVPG